LYSSIPAYYSDYAKKWAVEHAQVDEVSKLQAMVRASKNDSNPVANVSGKIANWLLS
jgi:hypothetical protein